VSFLDGFTPQNRVSEPPENHCCCCYYYYYYYYAISALTMLAGLQQFPNVLLCRPVLTWSNTRKSGPLNKNHYHWHHRHYTDYLRRRLASVEGIVTLGVTLFVCPLSRDCMLQ